MHVMIKREGIRRTWYDTKGRKHVEEVLTIYLNGVKLARGLCSRYAKRLVKLRQGEGKSFQLIEEQPE